MFKIYVADLDYLRKLHATDRICPFMENRNYENKPFAGVVFIVENHKYFIPLTSPKTKHLNMRNTRDFHKIDGGRLGALNINNMIPATEDFNIIREKDIHSLINSVDHEERKYGSLLNEQLTFINKPEEREKIRKKAIKLRQEYIDNTLPINIRERCVNFQLLETTLSNYIQEKEEEETVPPVE